MVSAPGSRAGWTPAHKERTNERTQYEHAIQMTLLGNKTSTHSWRFLPCQKSKANATCEISFRRCNAEQAVAVRVVLD